MKGGNKGRLTYCPACESMLTNFTITKTGGWDWECLDCLHTWVEENTMEELK